MIRFRLPVLFVAAAVVGVAAAFTHPAAAAPKPAATASPAPAPAPTATPETLEVQIPQLEAAVKANPGNTDAMTQLATDYLQTGRPDLAVQLTQKLLQGGTKNAQIYFVDGAAQAELGKTDAGIASMEQASDLEPTNIQVLQTLTQMYLRANRPADAERVAKRAVTFNPKSKDAAENYGLVLAFEKKYDEARAQFEAMEKLDPKDPHPLVLEARSYEDENSPALAMPLFDRALAIDSKDIEALAGKAELAASQHDVKTAIASYEQILAQSTTNPEKAAVVDQEGVVYAHEKQNSNADAAFRKAIDYYGNLPEAHIAYGDYLESINDKAGALREWTTAVGPNRDNPEALARLGQAAAESNDYAKAIDNYKRLTEVDAKDPRPYLLLGQAYMQSKAWGPARDAFKASFNLARSADALIGLAAADYQSHNYTEAIQIYESLDKNAQPLIKANPGLLFNMAQTYQSANQPQKAKAAYIRFLAFLKPGTQGYTQVKQMIAQIDKPAKPKPPAKPAAKPKPEAKPKPGATKSPTRK